MSVDIDCGGFIDLSSFKTSGSSKYRTTSSNAESRIAGVFSKHAGIENSAPSNENLVSNASTEIANPMSAINLANPYNPLVKHQ